MSKRDIRLALTRSSRIFLYSHDTFGLGHLRRNRKIAQAMRAADKDAQIVLASGSDMAERFPPLPGVELVQLPPVTKNGDGSYASPDRKLSLDALLERRSKVLTQSVRDLAPDIFVADKEPLGLLGELNETLALLDGGTRKILGLRDVLDSPKKLRAEWEARGVIERLPDLYDEIWIYGPQWFHGPLDGLGLPQTVLASCRHVGFLGTPDPVGDTASSAATNEVPADYILVTAGGGEDGDGLMRMVLAACETGHPIDLPLVLLAGPLMSGAARSNIEERVKKLPNVQMLVFDADPSALIANASAVVAMCGYNTFCEVLEADKPVLFVPREAPRQEQLIRAQRAAELGAAMLIRSGDAADPMVLSNKINALLNAPRPSSASRSFTFDGLDHIGRRVVEIKQQHDLVAIGR